MTGDLYQGVLFLLLKQVSKNNSYICNMNDLTTSEKLTIWMKRNGHTQEYIASKLDITRQTFILRLKKNEFKPEEKSTLTTLGFNW